MLDICCTLIYTHKHTRTHAMMPLWSGKLGWVNHTHPCEVAASELSTTDVKNQPLCTKSSNFSKKKTNESKNRQMSVAKAQFRRKNA